MTNNFGISKRFEVCIGLLELFHHWKTPKGREDDRGFESPSVFR